jgi:hypothetical protein
VLWIAIFIGTCALFAAWTSIRDHAEMRRRKLKRIQRRLAEKEGADGAE